MEYGRETVVLVEIDQPRCSRTYGDGALTLPVDGATFDGSNDYMTRGAGLTGAADSKTGIFSGWFRLDGGDGSQLNVFQAVATLGGLDSRVAVTRTTVNQFNFSLADSGGTVRLGIGTVATYLSGASWLHMLASWDLNTAGARSIYINDRLDFQQFTFTNATLDYTVADWVWGARGDGTNKFNGCMAELYFAPGQYLDFSLVENRRKFISAIGKPVFLGTTGEIPTGSSPLVYQHLDVAEAVANFATNRGSGGNFSITGTLTTATSSPSDNPGCQAVLGTTGARKCFNTRFTCQDVAHYAGDNTAEPALVLPGAEGNYASLPGSVGNTVRGDLDVRLKIAPDDWTPTARAALAAKISANTLALGWMVSLETDGTIRLWWSPDGVNLPFSASTVAPSEVTNGVAKWVRATLDVDDGAGNNVVTFYTSLDAETWTLVGTPVTSAGATSIFNNPTVGITIGTYLPLPSNYKWAGRVYAAEVRGGIEGAVVAKFDPPIDAMLADADSFTSTGTNDVWTINKSGYPRAAFEVKRLSLRFSYPQDGILQYGPLIPSLQELSTAPASVNLAGMDRAAGPMGVRESVTIGIEDHLHSDDLIDKYRLERVSGAAQSDGGGYDPYSRGTFWGKWLARNPYYPAYALRVYEGFLGDAVADMRVRHYVIDSIDGPTDGQVSVTAKDLFTAIEARKSVAPLPSNGALSADISAVAGSATLTPAGIGDLEYPAAGNVAIEEECITFTRAGDVLTLTARGALNTVAAAHKQEDLVQLVLSYASQLGVDIAYDLLLNYASLTTANLPKAQWDIAAAPLTELYTARIAAPTPVQDLLGELSEQAGFTLVADVSTNQIRFVPLRAATPTTTVDEDGWIAEESLSLKHQTENRLSEVWVYYAQINPTKSLDEPTNFRSRVVDADLGAEGNQQYGSPAIKEIFSRWIPQFGRGVAIDTGLRSLAMFRDPPLEAEFRLDVARDGELQPAQFFNLQVHDVQDDIGDALPIVMAPTQIERGENQIRVVAQQVRFYAANVPSGDRLIYIENDCFDLNLRTVYDSLFAAPVGTETVRFIVISGVRVGSTSTSIRALRTGSWPAGVALYLDNAGRIEPAGGTGGTTIIDSGGHISFVDATAGGDAIFAEFAITIDNLNGQIWSGGGGGGTGGAEPGGGGAGIVGGPPGGPYLLQQFVTRPAQYGTSESGGVGGIHVLGGTFQGGNGGGPGLAGQSGVSGPNLRPGGAAGKYIVGNAFVTWANNGDRRGGVS